MKEEISIPDEVRGHPAWQRLEDQHKWYSKESGLNQKWNKGLKLVQYYNERLLFRPIDLNQVRMSPLFPIVRPEYLHKTQTIVIF